MNDELRSIFDKLDYAVSKLGAMSEVENRAMMPGFADLIRGGMTAFRQSLRERGEPFGSRPAILISETESRVAGSRRPRQRSGRRRRGSGRGDCVVRVSRNRLSGSPLYGSGGGGVSSSRHLAARTVGSDGVPEMVTFWAKGALGPDPFVRDEGAW
jgi:hypothetical protein